MNLFKNILVPVDLSDSCDGVVQMASEFATKSGGRLIFCHVTLPPLPDEAMYRLHDVESQVLREHAEFKQIRPTDLKIRYDHLFLRGNPGPEILKAADDYDCDLIILSSHGRTGVMRWLMGSVAEYVSRHADCAVVMFRGPRAESEDKLVLPGATFPQNYTKSPFVTSAMQHAPPVHGYQEMERVITELKSADCTAAPVIDEARNCVGILTETDIDRYVELKKRLRERDEAVIDEVYETDNFGMRRTNSVEFDRVSHHMKSPVITISAEATCSEALEKLQHSQDIHHLVIVDRNHNPQGIVDLSQLNELMKWNTNQPIHQHN